MKSIILHSIELLKKFHKTDEDELFIPMKLLSKWEKLIKREDQATSVSVDIC